MDLLNSLGAITFIATLIAMYLVGKPDIKCYAFFCIGQSISIYIFYTTGQWFLILQMVGLIIFNIVNYFKWKRQGVG